MTLILFYRVEQKHVGCYVVTANNGVGLADKQRGYIDFNQTSSIQHHMAHKRRARGIEAPLIGVLTAIMILLLFCAFFMKFFRRSRSFVGDREVIMKAATKHTTTTNTTETTKSTVYLSHCAEGKGILVLVLKS